MRCPPCQVPKGGLASDDSFVVEQQLEVGCSAEGRRFESCQRMRSPAEFYAEGKVKNTKRPVQILSGAQHSAKSHFGFTQLGDDLLDGVTVARDGDFLSARPSHPGNPVGEPVTGQSGLPGNMGLFALRVPWALSHGVSWHRE